MALKLPNASDTIAKEGKAPAKSLTRDERVRAVHARPYDAEAKAGLEARQTVAAKVLAEVLTEDDCSNPECPYRDEVLAARKHGAARAKAYRERKAKKGRK